MSSSIKPFALLAYISIASEEKVKEEINGLKSVGRYESKQDAAGAYLAILPREGDKTKLTVLEMYDNKEYLMVNHQASAEFKTFRANAEHTRTKPVEVAFFAPKGGFQTRDSAPPMGLGEQFIWLAKLTAHPGKRDEMVAAAIHHAGNVQRLEDETYTFLILESTSDSNVVVLFERYSSEKYFQDVHATSESMKEYRAKIAPLLAERDSTGYDIVAGFVDEKQVL